MVRTIKITNGGITFTNGSLDMIGTRDKLDKQEKIQSLALRFLTQLGENNWASDEGFDYEGIFAQSPAIEDEIFIPKERVVATNIMKTIAQDEEISNEVDRLEIEREGNTIYVYLTVHTVDGREITDKFRLGGKELV